MSNKIVFDDGREVELSKETTERLRKELLNNIPEWISIGQIYEINMSYYISKVMIATFGDECGLTVVGNSAAGACNSGVLTGTLNKSKLRELLVKKDAKYLGTFAEVFETKKGN